MRPRLVVPLLALLALNLGLHFGLPEPRSSRSAVGALLFSARVEFDDDVGGDTALDASGWYGSEWDDHRNYAWTSARKSRLDFPPLRPGPYSAAFAVAHQVLARDPGEFGLLVNGRRVPLEWSQLPGLTMFRGDVPGEALAPGQPVRVVLLTPPPVSPQFLGKSENDDRMLGAAVDWLALTPRPSAQHVDFVRSLFGEGWTRPRGDGRRVRDGKARFTVPSPGPQAVILVRAEGPFTLTCEGRPVPLSRHGGLLRGRLAPQDDTLEFEVEGPALLQDAWLFDPEWVRGDAEALPALGPAWSPAGADPLGRPLRRMLRAECPLPVGDGVPARADLTVGLLARNNPHFPLHMPAHLSAAASPRLAVGGTELMGVEQGVDRLYRGEVLLNGPGLDLRVLEGRSPAFSWLELRRHP